MRWTALQFARAALRGFTEHSSPLNQTVYLTHVKWVTGKSKQLEKYFSRFGPVKDVSLFFDSESGLHRGFASLTFVKPESAAAAVQQRPHVIDGDLVSNDLFLLLLFLCGNANTLKIGVEFSIPLAPKKKFTTQ